MNIFITSILISILVPTVISIVMKESKKKVELTNDGILILKPPQIISKIGYLAVTISLLVLIIGFFGTIKSREDIIIWFSIVLLFLLLGLPLILQRKKIIMADQDKIIYRGITNREKQIRWGGVTKVTFSKSSEKLSLFEGDSKKIDVHVYMVGFLELIGLIKNKLEYSIYNKAVYDAEIVSKKRSSNF